MSQASHPPVARGGGFPSRPDPSLLEDIAAIHALSGDGAAVARLLGVAADGVFTPHTIRRLDAIEECGRTVVPAISAPRYARAVLRDAHVPGDLAVALPVGQL